MAFYKDNTKKLRIILLAVIFVFLLFSQLLAQKKLYISDDSKHYYTSVLVAESFYKIQDLCYKKHEGTKIITSAVLAFGVGCLKEVFDNNRCNRNKRTGFSKSDLQMDAWACFTYLPIKLCLNDNKKKKHENFNYPKYNFK